MIALWVALGAAVGAPARYLLDRGVQTRHHSVMPWGTLSVNVIASFLFGLVAGAAGDVSPQVAALVGPGFCGALSTFSTFSYETVRLAQQRRRSPAAVNVLLGVVFGVGTAALGYVLTR